MIETMLGEGGGEVAEEDNEEKRRGKMKMGGWGVTGEEELKENVEERDRNKKTGEYRGEE